MCTIFSYHVIINNSAVNIFIHVPWYTGICFSLGYMPQRATAVLWGHAHFSFIRYHQIILTRGVQEFLFPNNSYLAALNIVTFKFLPSE